MRGVKNKHWFYVLLVVTVLTIGFTIAVWIYETKTGVDLTNFTVTLVSSLISLVALFIALQTYLSIDSVNNVSKMEGNIIDNEFYVTSVPELIHQYPQTDVSAFSTALLDGIEKRLKTDSKTAVDFADTLQHIIDLLVFFPSFYSPVKGEDLPKGHPTQRVETILTLIKSNIASFQSISKGNSIQLREAAKLIEAVVNYQRQAVNNGLAHQSGILAVRGPILRNGVAATIYYNYLGLYYRRRAVAVLVTKEEAKPESAGYLRKLMADAKGLSQQQRERMQRLLNEADEAFEKARKHCADDPLWLGYILFNKARIKFMQQAFLGMPVDAVSAMSQALTARMLLNELIDSLVGDTEPTVLQRHYWYQEAFAQLLLNNYCQVLTDNAPDRSEEVDLDSLLDSDKAKLGALRA